MVLTGGVQGGEKIAETINQLGFDAMTLGNHEFDRGDDFVGAFVRIHSKHDHIY
jgi:2',3'-cyclic-nucleotide 2'-phosphodiesterase (5'-nucleotidase family)